MRNENRKTRPVLIPENVYRVIDGIRRSGIVNMLDRPMVIEIARQAGFEQEAAWIEQHSRKYAESIFRGATVRGRKETLRMCGLCGILYGNQRRSSKDRKNLLDIFTRLLVLSESRGRHASGIAWIKADGSCDVFKAPVPASELVRQDGYTMVINAVDNKTTMLMGHARWRTQGSEKNNSNNQPFVLEVSNNEIQKTYSAPRTVLAHNGHISNADMLFRRFHFPRQAQVDSEIIAHFAADAVRDRRWDLDILRRHLALCRGTITAILASTAAPMNVVIAKGNKPLSLLYSHRRRVIIYASEMSLLVEALGDNHEWEELHLPAMTLAIFDCGQWMDYRQETFRLSESATLGRWACR